MQINKYQIIMALESSGHCCTGNLQYMSVWIHNNVCLDMIIKINVKEILEQKIKW